jgi:hypothetical protein
MGALGQHEEIAGCDRQIRPDEREQDAGRAVRAVGIEQQPPSRLIVDDAVSAPRGLGAA